MAACAFSGLVASSGSDGGNVNTANSQHPTTGNATTTQSDLIISVAAAASIGVWTQNQPAGFTNVTNGGAGGTWAGSIDYQINAAASTYNADYGTAISGTREWSAAIAGIKALLVVVAQSATIFYSRKVLYFI